MVARGVPQKPWWPRMVPRLGGLSANLFAVAPWIWITKSTQFYRLTLVSVVERRSGGIATMSYLFAAVLLLSSPGCPHEESTCLTPTEYVEVNLRPDVSMLEALRL